jgi:hypothetical protein
MGSIKLQFAISDDLKQSVTVFNSEVQNLQKNIDEVNAMSLKIRGSVSNANKQLSTYGKLTIVAENKAKELGVDAKSIPGYSDALKAQDSLSAMISKANEYD